MFKTCILFIKRLGITCSNFLAIGKTDGISIERKWVILCSCLIYKLKHGHLRWNFTH